MRRTIRFLAPILAAAATLSACQKEIEAPFNKGVCYHAVKQKDGKIQFFKVADNEPNIEHCAAALEGMRERFLSLGGNQHDLTGAYQGSWLFLNAQGIFIAQKLDGIRYLALVRTGDGMLAQPGAVPNNQ